MKAERKEHWMVAESDDSMVVVLVSWMVELLESQLVDLKVA